MKNFSFEDKIVNSIVIAVLSIFPWVFVIEEYKVIPVVIAIQLVVVLALNIYVSFVKVEEGEEKCL